MGNNTWLDPALIDLDGDGTLDVVVTIRATNDLVFLRGRGDGTLDAPRRWGGGGVNASSDAAYDVELTDLDGDGRLDLVYTQHLDGVVRRAFAR